MVRARGRARVRVSLTHRRRRVQLAFCAVGVDLARDYAVLHDILLGLVLVLQLKAQGR